MARAWKFADSVNTDLITPGRYNMTLDMAELGRIAFIEHRPEYAKSVRSGDFLVAGRNFGCGSSRETAVYALKANGLAAIVAKSYARIFYRNCINNGVMALVAPTSFVDSVQDGDEMEIADGKLVNRTRRTSTPVSIPPLMSRLREFGGILNFLKKHKIEELESSAPRGEAELPAGVGRGPATKNGQAPASASLGRKPSVPKPSARKRRA
ncbi:MAG: 3-isopropylmalate dehydratase [Candidatus Marsarchaeota archaeon]|nr:3-isopropylmalate dehydratase [Candidatus Marsarchaeota archaeon]